MKLKEKFRKPETTTQKPETKSEFRSQKLLNKTSKAIINYRINNLETRSQRYEP